MNTLVTHPASSALGLVSSISACMAALALALAVGEANAASPEEAPMPVEAVAVEAEAEVSEVEVVEARAAEADIGIQPDLELVDYEPEYNPNFEIPYEPEPKRRKSLELDSAYFSLGIAPGMTLHRGGFHPNTRFELEFGGMMEHSYRDLGLSFGVVTHVTPYYERKAPSFGADVVATALLGPVYLRTGLGAVGGLPRGHQLHNKAAGVGGVVGVGLNLGREPMMRVGIDYDFRVNTKLEPTHTVFLVVRLVCCRD